MRKEKTMSKVAVKENKVPSKVDWTEDAGLGLEDAAQDEFKLPLIKILYSSNMPDGVDKTVSGTDVAEGCVFNQTSEKAYDGKQGFYAVPCMYKRSFNEWKEMDEGNNRPVAVHKDKPLGLTRNGNKDVLPNGNYVEDTGNWFILILDKDKNVVDQGMVTMKSTQKKKSNEWLQKIKSNSIIVDGKPLIPPMYKCIYRMSTTRQESGKYKFFGWQIKFEGYLDDSKDVHTLAQSREFAHFAKDLNLYFEAEVEQEEPTKKSTDKVPF